MFSDAAAKNRDPIGNDDRDPPRERYVAIRIDSMNWKMFVVGGVIAAAAALLPTVQIFDPTTVRGAVFAGGMCAIVAGLRLRHRFNRSIDRQVQGIIAQYK
jgi:hypothetical protein